MTRLINPTCPTEESVNDLEGSLVLSTSRTPSLRVSNLFLSISRLWVRLSISELCRSFSENRRTRLISDSTGRME